MRKRGRALGYFARRKKFGRKRRKHFNNKNKFPKKSHAKSAEGIVASAFAELVSESFFNAYVRAKHNDSLDASHIDIVAINFYEPKLFVLQVKTKVKKKICHHNIAYCEECETPIERHKRKYSYIPVIEVGISQKRFGVKKSKKVLRIRIRNAKKEIKRLYQETPSAETFLDKRTLNIIAEKFAALGHEVFFKN